METFKAIIVTNRPIFVLVGIAFLMDISGIANSLIPGSVFGLPSALAVVNCLGVSIIIRLVIAKRRVHLAIAYLIVVFLYFDWFVITSIFSDGGPSTPSLLFLLCLFASFHTLRFENHSKATRSVAET